MLWLRVGDWPNALQRLSGSSITLVRGYFARLKAGYSCYSPNTGNPHLGASGISYRSILSVIIQASRALGGFMLHVWEHGQGILCQSLRDSALHLTLSTKIWTVFGLGFRGCSLGSRTYGLAFRGNPRIALPCPCIHGASQAQPALR